MPPPIAPSQCNLLALICLTSFSPSRDHWSKVQELTAAGEVRFCAGMKERWVKAQRRFEGAVGVECTKEIRVLLHAVAVTDLGATAISVEE